MDFSHLENFDKSGMWHQDNFTDQKHGMLTRMTPVGGDGFRDAERQIKWYGQITLNWRGQPIPVPFEIPNARSLAHAIDGYIEAAKQAAQEKINELEASHIKQTLTGSLLNSTGLPIRPS